MRFVFLHGGPGFNSLSEQAILGPIFRSQRCEAAFWNEPSSLRPDGERFDADEAFTHWLGSAEQYVLRWAASGSIHLIAHSITVLAAMDIARRHAAAVSSLTIVAPAVDPFATFRNVLKLAHDDLRETRPDVAAAIADSLEHTRSLFDEPMRGGLLNVLQDERLFTHYWADAGQLQASMAARAGTEGQFDVNSFFAVLGDFARRGADLLATTPVTVPTLALFGARDPVTPMDEQWAAVETAVPGARMEVLDGCSHYVHLDRPQFFVDRLVRWARHLE